MVYAVAMWLAIRLAPTVFTGIFTSDPALTETAVEAMKLSRLVAGEGDGEGSRPSSGVGFAGSSAAEAVSGGCCLCCLSRRWRCGGGQ